ncbi:hypothetical protein [Taibaiella soli]|nr:hypothetical protein [Taibaiella soli]
MEQAFIYKKIIGPLKTFAVANFGRRHFSPDMLPANEGLQKM